MLTLSVGVAGAQVHVNGYTKKDGTYVAPHERTAPDATKANNYSTQGNTNPYTGKAGTVSPDPALPIGTQTPQYQQPAYQQPTYQQPGAQPVQPSRKSSY
jgi:hypothetical protein